MGSTTLPDQPAVEDRCFSIMLDALVKIENLHEKSNHDGTIPVSYLRDINPCWTIAHEAIHEVGDVLIREAHKQNGL